MTAREYPKCPRCGGLIPNGAMPGAYPGAISRWDDQTEICSACGADEAMIQYSGGLASRGLHDGLLHPTQGVRAWVTPIGGKA